MIRLKRLVLAIMIVLICPVLLSCAKKTGAEADRENVTENESETKEQIEEENEGENAMTGENAKVSKLSVKGTRLVDETGKVVRLQGVSTHGLSWYPQYVNKESFQTIKDDWHANVMRLAMYTAEYNGYCEGDDANRQNLKEVIDRGVKACVDLDMYVIIDWHILSDNNPLMHEKEAKAFFDEMSKKYADIPNVIYEICNEPNNSSWTEQIKPYAESVIPVIRNNAPDAVIIVGTNTWSQDVDQVAAAPLPFDNVMYALHFYAGTHKENLRAKAKKALDAGTPVFISECSITDASGNGAVDRESAEEWKDFIISNNLSCIEWSLANKDESSAILKADCQKTSGYTDSDLNESGKWFKDFMSAN